MAGLLANHARVFKWMPCPARVPVGTPGHCHETAYWLAKDHGFIYCEGLLVSSSHTMAHAWNCSRDGLVVDSTLRSETEPRLSYYGIPFKTEYIVKHHRKVGYYGLMDGHPTLGEAIGPYVDPPSLWLHPLPHGEESI